MKINALTLKNLNSLRGEFRLDFDAQPLADAGIFAITGPTGAGKTTILDAICVALYGQTPRLPPGSSAELLTRNTGECFAEVEFTVEQGRYRSRWSRRKARGRAEGNLQPTAMELVEISPEGEERIVEEQVRQVVERVESLTGLDFSRFTRSVLLAQGSFASFLKAKDNERAELLERMTGTRLYSLISVQAFSRAREERQRLDEMIAVNAHLNVMPSEQLVELRERKVTIETEIITATSAIAEQRDQAATAIRYQDLMAAINEAEQSLVVVNAEQTEATASLDRLAQAELALPLFSDVRALDALAERLDRLRAESLKLSGQSEALHKSEEEARQGRLVLDQEVERFTQTATVREEAIRTAEMMDEQIRIHGVTRISKQQAVAVADATMSTLQADAKKHRDALAESLIRLQTINAILSGSAADAGLAHDIGIIAATLRELSGGRQRYAANRREQERLSAGIARQQKEIDGLRVRQAAAGLEITAIRNRLVQCEDRLAETLHGGSWEDLESALSANRQRLSGLESVLVLEAEYQKLVAERRVKEERKKGIIEGLGSDGIRRQQLVMDQSQAEQILLLMEEKQRLAAQVAKYEADRRCLADGHPCPLCGAVSHPWQEGAPAMDENRAAVTAQRKKVAALLANLATLDGRMQELSELAKTLEHEIAALIVSHDQLRARLVRERAEVDLTAAHLTAEIKTDVVKAIALQQQRLLEARTIQAERDGLIQQLLVGEKAESAVVGELEKLLALIQDQGTAVQRFQEEDQELCARGKALGLELEGRLAIYGITLPAPGQEEATAELLHQRWQRFDQARQDRSVIESQALEVKQILSVLATQEEGLRARREQDLAAVTEVTTTIEALTVQRVAVLGSETVAAARRQLTEAWSAYAARIKESDRIISELTTHAAAALGAFTENIQQMERMAEESQRFGQALDQRLHTSGFADLTTLRQALLPEAELQSLRGVRDGFVLRRQRLDDRLREARAQRHGLGEKAAGINLEVLQITIAKAGESLSQLQQELGALSETIRRQDKLMAEHRERSALIDNQRREQRHWQLLSDMIGSADGKKFRRFAQGLTLDHLIHLANRQLVRLSDRYLLRRHQDEELGLEIIDTYQADAIRPTGTLSGGEEFLVSLALALGLARLSGQSRIDSLFLDEGFGTLDTETLETALSALSALHETGKTIGVISHVDALKERIPVQIRLRRLAGGYSNLSVVG